MPVFPSGTGTTPVLVPEAGSIFVTTVLPNPLATHTPRSPAATPTGEPSLATGEPVASEDGSIREIVWLPRLATHTAPSPKETADGLAPVSTAAPAHVAPTSIRTTPPPPIR